MQSENDHPKRDTGGTMKRRLIAFALSLGTLVGGHFYNGRWAKASFFAALLLCVFAVAALILIWGLFDFSAREFIDRYESRKINGQLKTLATVVTVIAGVIWVVSAFMAAFDARGAADGEPKEAPFTRRLAVVAMCGFGLLVVLGSPFVWYVSRPKPAPKRVSRPPRPTLAPWRYMQSGPTIVNTAPPLPPTDYRNPGVSWFTGTAQQWLGSPWLYPPSEQIEGGRGAIRGRVRLNGKPLAGLKLQLYATPQSKTQMATTDNDGYYSIAVVPDEYGLAGWNVDGASAASLLYGKMTSPGLPPLSGPTSVTVLADTITSGPNFEFVDPIACVHPFGETRITSETVFQWAPHPGAAYYKLDLKAHGTLLIFGWVNPVVPTRETRLEGTTTTVALAGFDRLPGGVRYSWGIEAFNTSGTLLSETPETGRPRFRVK